MTDDPSAAAAAAAAARRAVEQAGDGSWRLTSGQVRTLDEYLGYVFTRRRETPEEYRRRAAASSAPLRGFRLLAGFAEHDEKFGATAEVVIRRAAAPVLRTVTRGKGRAPDRETRAVLAAWPLRRRSGPDLSSGDGRSCLDGVTPAPAAPVAGRRPG